MKTYECIYCGNENTWGRTKVNKYCNNKCQLLHRWETVDRPRVEAGNGGPRTIKRYLTESNNLCAECGQTSIYNNKPLTLQVDHIDGDSDNNNLNNVRLLCPNCHTQTETYGSKGNGNRYKKITKRNKYLQNYKLLYQ